jgi:hypothetical protein
MEPIRKKDVEPEHDADVLQDIAADARALKDRYLEETVVPEGGE